MSFLSTNVSLFILQELFIQYLAQQSLLFSGSDGNLEYKDVAEIVDRDHKLEFLRGMNNTCDI